MKTFDAGWNGERRTIEECDEAEDGNYYFAEARFLPATLRENEKGKLYTYAIGCMELNPFAQTCCGFCVSFRLVDTCSPFMTFNPSPFCREKKVKLSAFVIFLRPVYAVYLAARVTLFFITFLSRNFLVKCLYFNVKNEAIKWIKTYVTVSKTFLIYFKYIHSRCVFTWSEFLPLHCIY